MGRINKAVITAGGSGSRLLPFSKEMPKEMLPYCARTKNDRLVTKPIIQAVFESLYEYGCREFCFVVGRGKRSIEDHFLPDHSTNGDLQDLYGMVRSSSIEYVQQPFPLGFGDAVLRAKKFVGDSTFLLCAGDDVVVPLGGNHIRRLEDALFSFDVDMAFLVENAENPEQYGVIAGERASKGVLMVRHLEEKPQTPKTNLAIIATYASKPSILCALEETRPDRNGELQLSDAIIQLVSQGRCVAVELESGERRMDVGTPASYAACIKNSLEDSGRA